MNKIIVCATTALLSISQCLASSPKVENIFFSKNVPQDQVTLIQSDIQALKAMNFSNPDPEMLSLMQIKDSSPATLLNWLQERVHFLVEENFDLKSNSKVDKLMYTFPNQDIMPNMETSSKTPTDTSDVKIVMFNVGGLVYLTQKQKHVLLEVNIPGVGKEKVTSPRVGVIEVGAGMFPQNPAKPADSKPYVAMRLSTLFHEAHHSDGNGKSLGFIHAVCPSGTYEGYTACDRNLNGPYQIEAAFLKSMIQSCTDCTDGDKVSMNVLQADAASRQIKFTPDPNAPNPSSEASFLQDEIKSCDLLAKLNMQSSIPACADEDGLKKKLADLQTQAPSPGIPSTLWDPTPEGQFSL